MGKYKGDPEYKFLEWEHNCVLHALSKVLGESLMTLAKRLVDGGVGGLTMISELENNSKILSVLTALGFTQLKAGGCNWQDARKRMGSRGEKGRLYAVWWHGKATKEDWTDADTGGSDHAFAIYCNPSDLEVPTTNMPDFDLNHPTDDEWVSVFIPPTLIPCTQRPNLPKHKGTKGVPFVKGRDERRGDRRFDYN